jgi:hypothetical protein
MKKEKLYSTSERQEKIYNQILEVHEYNKNLRTPLVQSMIVHQSESNKVIITRTINTRVYESNGVNKISNYYIEYNCSLFWSTPIRVYIEKKNEEFEISISAGSGGYLDSLDQSMLAKCYKLMWENIELFTSSNLNHYLPSEKDLNDLITLERA